MTILQRLFRRGTPKARFNPSEESTPEIKPILFCSVCKKKLNFVDSHKCKYCNEWHCLEHMPPEKHNCKSPSLPIYMSGIKKITNTYEYK